MQFSPDFRLANQVPVPVLNKLINKLPVIYRLWNLACGRRLHSQQQEFITVYECVDKVGASFLYTSVVDPNPK
jgi:hypothetical protein